MKLRSIFSMLAVSLVTMACAVESSDDSGVERGPLGKADSIGSCATPDGANFCGEQSDGTCWCDAKCQEYGDCCSDVVETCGQEIGDVLPICFSTNDCDDGEICDMSECLSPCAAGEICPAVCAGVCEDVGDIDPCSLVKCASGTHCVSLTGSAQCVPDVHPCAAVLCGPGTTCVADGTEASCVPINPVKCNVDLPCEDDEYCHWDANEACGVGTGSGVCTPTPQACTKELDPVCGCDGEVYGNPCEANMNGLSWVPAALSNNGYICPNVPTVTPGSCENQCGGSASTCYCDDQCSSFGDCCDDYEAACAA